MKSSRARIAGSSAGLTAAASPPAKAVSCDVLASRAAWAVKKLRRQSTFLGRGKTRQNLLEGRTDETLGGAIGRRTRFLPQACRQPPRLLERERAIRQRQGLLRHDALAAPVAFVHARHVEQLQKRHLLFVGVLEIQAPPRHRQPLAHVRDPPRRRSRRAARPRTRRCRARSRPPCVADCACHSKRLSGSIARRGSSAVLVEIMRYACEVTISRCIDFMLQPRSMNSTASQSSSARASVGVPLTPKLKTVATSGSPKCRIHIWFTATRAVSGLFRWAIQRASASRRPVLVAGIKLVERRIIGALVEPRRGLFPALCALRQASLRPSCVLAFACRPRLRPATRRSLFGHQNGFFAPHRSPRRLVAAMAAAVRSAASAAGGVA